MSVSIDEVVVLPWVPATASISRSEHSAPSTSALVATRIPRAAAATSSTLSAADGRRAGDEVGVADVAGVVPDAHRDARGARARRPSASPPGPSR